MEKEIDLLVNYPKAKRNLEERLASKTEADRAIARQFGKDFFDGDRNHGYGGFGYLSRFWQPVIPTFQDYWKLNADSSILDVGSAKGFMLHDLAELIPGITVKGVDISEYAIENTIEDIQVANATTLPFPDNSFDVVISINTVHNLERDECAKALREIQRVSRGNSFITVDAYRNDEEKERMYAWNLTAKTIMSVDEWVQFFDEIGYTGDYFWFIP
jgi:SAM-dependent methyltransferase